MNVYSNGSITIPYPSLLVLVLLSSCSLLADDTQSWLAVSKQLGKAKGASFSLDGEGRFGDDLTRAKNYIFGPRVKYRLGPTISLNSAVQLFYTRAGDRFAKAIRYDLGMNFKLRLSERWQFDQRIRYEFFDWERTSGIPRLRSRSQFSRPLSGNRLIGWYAGVELMYETKEALFTQFRFVPFGFKFALSERVALNAHYLLMDRPNKPQNHVLVTSFTF